MSRESEEFVVVKAVHPSWCTTQLPGEVAELLGAPPEKLARAPREERTVAFLRRPEGTARAILPQEAPDLFAAEMVAGRVLATAQLTDKLVFNIPSGLEAHLGLVTFRRGDGGARGTDDTLAWFLPRSQYEEYRRRSREVADGTPRSLGGPPRVYLCRSVFRALRPGLREPTGSEAVRAHLPGAA